jgi:prepilin-type N-terminal cleavage/methylation domain-containing protein
MKRPLRRGFTLIELMIVVAIIGLLAVIAVPKFASLVRKSNEASTKAGLGSLRSALTIYHSNTDGEYPTDHLECLLGSGFYLARIPKCDLPPYHVVTTAISNNSDLSGTALLDTDVGGWVYYNDPAFDAGGVRNLGEIWVGCLHDDTKLEVWSSH